MSTFADWRSACAEQIAVTTIIQSNQTLMVRKPSKREARVTDRLRRAAARSISRFFNL